MATKKVILKEIVNGVVGDTISPKTSIDMVEGLEEALAAAGSVSTISVNGGAPLTPDNNKNIDITIPSTVTEATVSGWGFTKNTGTYSKPSEGIPSTDFTSAVQTSLGKADTAIQSVTVGTTTTGAAGSSASVTNAGTATEPVLSFTIPQGAQGIQGIQGPQGERGPQGNTGVQVDSVASIIHSIDPTATYAAADVAGADAVQDVLSEVTELEGNVDGLMTEVGRTATQVNLASYPNVMFTINASGVWATTSNANHSIFVPMQDGEYTLTASTSTQALYTVLTSNATPTAGATPAYATGYSNRISIPTGGTVTVQGTSGLYLWMRNDTVTNGVMPPTVMFSSGNSRIDELYEAIEDGYTENRTVDVLTEYDVSSMLATSLNFRSNAFVGTSAASSLLLPHIEGAKTVSVTSSVEFRTNELKDISEGIIKPYKNLPATWVAGAGYGTGARTFTLNAQTKRIQLQFKSIDAETIISGTTSIKIYCENYRKLLKDADIVDNTTDGGADKVLSAEQGKVLNEKIDNEIDTLSTDINDKLSELTSQVEHLNEAWFDVEEEGLYFVDKYLHVGAKIDGNGFHAININEQS